MPGLGEGNRVIVQWDDETVLRMGGSDSTIM
jgi:hypothetical protein